MPLSLDVEGEAVAELDTTDLPRNDDAAGDLANKQSRQLQHPMRGKHLWDGLFPPEDCPPKLAADTECLDFGSTSMHKPTLFRTLHVSNLSEEKKTFFLHLSPRTNSATHESPSPFAVPSISVPTEIVDRNRLLLGLSRCPGDCCRGTRHLSIWF